MGVRRAGRVRTSAGSGLAPGVARREKRRSRDRRGRRRARDKSGQSEHGEASSPEHPDVFSRVGGSTSDLGLVTNVLKKINIRTIVPCQEPKRATAMRGSPVRTGAI